MMDSGVAATFDVVVRLAPCSSTTRVANIELKSPVSFDAKISFIAIKVSYLTPAGNRPPFGASNPINP